MNSIRKSMMVFLPLALFAGCDATVPGSAGDELPAASAQALTGFTFDTTGIARPPSGGIPTDQLTLSAFSDAVIARGLIQTTEPFAPGMRLSDISEQVSASWKFEKAQGEGALLVLNDTRVVPARLRARKLTPDGAPGGQVELLLCEPAAAPGEAPSPGSDLRWRAMYRASKPLRDGGRLELLAPDGSPAGLPPALLQKLNGCPNLSDGTIPLARMVISLCGLSSVSTCSTLPQASVVATAERSANFSNTTRLIK